MVSRPTLTEIKLQCRIDYDYDDSLLDMYEKGAFKYLESYINREIITDDYTELTDNQIRFTDELKIAELMIISSYYSNRETVSSTNMNIVPMASQSILEMYRISNVW